MVTHRRVVISCSAYLLFVAACALAPAYPAFAQSCGDAIVDPGEDCEAPFGPCCDSLTCLFTAVGATCRAGSADVCDPDEVCSGTSDACPADAVTPIGTTCRASVSTCDIAESCGGMPGGTCPADGFVVAGTSCDDTQFCTVTDVCDGAGGCGGSARNCADVDPCTVDGCNESSDLCENVTSPAVCDDGNPCTVDSCDSGTGCSNAAEPRDMCLAAGRTGFRWRDSTTNDEQDYVRWSWRRGAAFPVESIGDPRTVTGYALCVYDQVAAVPSLVTSLVVPPGSLLWGLRNGRAEYVDRTGSVDGVRKIRIRSGEAATTKVQFGASGVPLDLPAPAEPDFQFRADPAVIVQMVNSDDVCWTSSFARDDIQTNRYGRFKAAAN